MELVEIGTVWKLDIEPVDEGLMIVATND